MSGKLAFLFAAMGSAHALAAREAGCSFTAMTGGAVSYPVGQLGSGQSRAGGSLSASTFTINGSAITDAQGRGCWWTPPATVLQCDVGQIPETGFEIGCDGSISFNGQTTFYECATGDSDEVNIYLLPNQGTNCAEITLTAAGCYSTACSSANSPSSQSATLSQSSSDASAVYPTTQYPETTVVSSTGAETTLGSSTPEFSVASETLSQPQGTDSYPTTTETPDQPIISTIYSTTMITVTSCGPDVTGCPDETAPTVTETSTATEFQCAQCASTETPAIIPSYSETSATESLSTPTETPVVISSYSETSPEQASSTMTAVSTTPATTPATNPGYSPSSGADSSSTEHSVSSSLSASLSVSSDTGYSYSVTTPAYSTPQPSPNAGTSESVSSTSTYELSTPLSTTQTTPEYPTISVQTSAHTSESTTPSYPTSSTGLMTETFTTASVPTSLTTFSYVASTPSTSLAYSTTSVNTVVSTTQGVSVPSPSSVTIPESCPGNVTNAGEFTLPSLIITIDSSSPDVANGTTYYGDITPTRSTIFNFDIPSTAKGKTCDLVFLFPEKDTLETSTYTFSGSGVLDFSKLSSTATQDTCYSNAPSVETDLGEFTVSPGNAYNVNSFSCPAGMSISIEIADSSGDNTNLWFFQDYNPCPLGLFITTS